MRALGLHAASDPVVLGAARDDERVVVSADTDFGALLARTGKASPSVVLVRRLVGRRVDDPAAVLLNNLPVVDDDLSAGSVVVLGEETVRVRPLPMR